MSDDEELRKLREKRLAELQNQQNAQQYQENAQIQQAQQAQYEAQKNAILAQVLSTDARARLTNIKMARPEFAENIEAQLIQAFQQGMLKGQIPLSDQKFKNILIQIQQQSQKRERQIKFR